MTPFSIDPGPLAIPFTASIARLEQLQFAEALWTKRLDVWTDDAAVQAKIGHRLGWLSALDFVAPQLGRLETFARSIRDDGFTDVVLLGMGGSSLAPEVLRQVLGVGVGMPRFRMLDSVDPDAVRAALDRPASTLFLLASKSGSTIEPNSMAAEAQRRVIAAGIADWGSRFVAITDEGTPAYERAVRERFREIFVNPADIGGRYSALSFFGLVPAALMGADLTRLVSAARDMETACKSTNVQMNPGLALGALMAAGAAAGRDKVTLQMPDTLQSFGLWVEQLVAESTGKQGKGVVPITGEPGAPKAGSDRVTVRIVLEDQTGSTFPEAQEKSRPGLPPDAPSASLTMADTDAIGAEFLRWEVATAAAGVLLGINPFDEPNVQQAKDATRALLATYRQQRQLPAPEAHAAIGGIRLTLSNAAAQTLDGKTPEHFLTSVGAGDYIGLLAYVPPDVEPFATPLTALRAALHEATGVPTMFGYGPRYLHSTGQLHKGGANNGVFIVVTAPAAEDLPIPGEAFSFGVLSAAQALGDFQSLDRTGRRALLIQLPNRDVATLDRVRQLLIPGLNRV